MPETKHLPLQFQEFLNISGNHGVKILFMCRYRGEVSRPVVSYGRSGDGESKLSSLRLRLREMVQFHSSFQGKHKRFMTRKCNEYVPKYGFPPDGQQGTESEESASHHSSENPIVARIQ